MATVTKELMALLRAAMRGECPTEVSEESLSAVVALARTHDVAHLLAEPLSALSLKKRDTAWGEAVYRAQMAAIYRQEQLAYTAEVLFSALEEAAVPYIPLKGAILRTLYPEEWMRTSCDIDVLVHEEDLGRAAKVLTESRGFIVEGQGSHDLSLFHENGVHVELHYTLREDHLSPAGARVLDTVWAHSTPDGEDSCRRVLSDAFFYCYHVAHMAKHVELGGCGIRPILDLWLLDGVENADSSGREALLSEAGLTSFARAARALSRVWLDGEAHDDVTARLERFILTGGVYGTLENQIKATRKGQGGKLSFALGKIFLPYDRLKHQYPVIKRPRWLTPFFEVVRWLRILFGGRAADAARTLEANRKLNPDEVREVSQLLLDLGL